jgi:hypothetical protein
MDRTPVFVFHSGNPLYLQYTIKQAEKFNIVHLLGDTSNKNVCEIWCESEKYVPSDYFEFEKSFVQMSDYPLDFDLNCFKRFFIMRDYMEKHNIQQMLFADSDLLLYVDVTEYYEKYKCKASLSIPNRQDNFRWTAQAHCSFWTLEYLTDFLRFTIDFYKNNIEILQDKYNYHITHSIRGGVCDMTLLYLWSCSKESILNICESIDGAVFDHCISDSGNYYDNEYKYNVVLQAKKVVFDEMVPYCEKTDGERTKMYALHCQGSAKALIPHLLDGNMGTLATYKERYEEVAKRLLKKYRRK